ncbi:MAG: aromatic-ring-hydroxylating dioxygenase subunit beta [Pseudomonadota bacterium]
MTAMPKLGADVDAQTERQVARFLTQYTRCLDEDRLEDWPSFFSGNGVYRALSRENEALGLPAPLMYYYSRAMMEDRVTALRDALTYEPVYTRHITSGLLIERGDDVLISRSDFALYQSTEEGITRLFAVGAYQDTITQENDRLAFIDRRVIVDTFGIQNLIATPL